MFSWFTGSLFLLLLTSCIHHRVASAEKYVDPNQNHPIIIIPGLLGSSIEAKRDDFYSDWYTIWYNKDVLHFFGSAVDDWVQDFRRELTADVNDPKTKNPDGLETRVVGWGSTVGIEDLSSYSRQPSLFSSQNQTPQPTAYAVGGTTYFKNLVTQLVKKMHYIRDETILGAPYDFRRAPYDNLDYFDKLNTLILDTYIANGNKSVIIISHSMGCLQFLYFLQSKSQAWKDQFIRGWIPIAGPFGGSVKMLSALTKGVALRMDWYPNEMKKLMRTFSSSYFLLPDERIFGDQTVLRRHYKREGRDRLIELSAKDMRHILFDIYDFKDDIRMFDAASGDLNGSIYDQHPGVNTHCVYSHGISTIETLNFREEQHYDDHTHNGDGSTLYLSAELCKKWVDSNSPTKDSYKEFHNIEHTALVTNNEPINHVISIVEKLNDCGVTHPSPVWLSDSRYHYWRFDWLHCFMFMYSLYMP